MSGQPLEGPPLGPDKARSVDGSGPALLVRIVGLKGRQDTVRVRLFGGSPDTYFVREKALVCTQIPVPSLDPIRICVTVLRPGVCDRG